MSTPRRRPTSGIRRPQVAGRPRTGHTENDEPEDDTGAGGIAVEERSGSGLPAAAPVRSGTASGTRSGTADEDGAADGDGTDGDTRAAADDDTGAEGGTGPAPRSRRRLPLPSPPASRAGTAALLAVTVLLTAAAVFFGYSWYTAGYTGSAANTALTDVGATAEVSQQVGEAVTKVYSFDHARLEQAEGDARAVITPAFQPEFDRIFGSVRELAPQQQAVVTATIPKSAVASITGDRATVYVFVNQVIRRQAADGPPQEGAAAARLRVDAEFLDGRWKIAAMTPA